jgi:hypothetical protein
MLNLFKLLSSFSLTLVNGVSGVLDKLGDRFRLVKILLIKLLRFLADLGLILSMLCSLVSAHFSLFLGTDMKVNIPLRSGDGA